MRSFETQSRQNALVLFALFTFLITCWHFYGPSIRHAAPVLPAFSNTKLPKYWSVSGKGNLEGVTDFKKPDKLKVVALVFYGRPASVSILDCYLKVELGT